MNVLGEKRAERWEETVSGIDFTHSSRKAWATMNRLTGRSSKPRPCPVTANSIASVLVNNGRWNDRSAEAKAHSYHVNAEIKTHLASQPASSPLSKRISREELMDAIIFLPNGKAPGVDQAPPELLKHMGLQPIEWLRDFLSDCLEKTTIPAIWRQAKVSAILKPCKPSEKPESYRPISLLCMSYKLMERIILSRINHIVERYLPHAQAGFRKNRSTTDQITRLANDIESSFQRNEKYGLVLIDLTAAYDTVWHRGLYLKLLCIIPDVKLVRFMMVMIQNRSFYVETSSGERSRKRMLRNGLPQGSVLAPILFNIYTSDLPPTTSKQFLYADDSALGVSGSFDSIEHTLESDLATMSRYFHLWHLKMSEAKTVCSVFHLANRLSKREITVMHNGRRLKFEREPVYLGVTFDRRSTSAKLHRRQAKG